MTAVKRFGVVGLGQTGVSVVHYLRRRGLEVIAFDTRKAPPGLKEIERLGLPCHLGPLSPKRLRQCTHLVISPGLPLTEPAIAEALRAGVQLVGELDLFSREAEAPIVAITGTNGKSTTTALLGEMARQGGFRVAVGGNFGTPMLDLLAEKPELYVLELSSFQLERTFHFRAEAAVVLNISPDHLDRHPTFESYAAIKGKLYFWAERQVVNLDDLWSRKLALPSKPTFTLSLETEADYHLENAHLARRGRRLLARQRLLLQGRHNLTNALAALALAEQIGLPLEASLKALETFRGLPHRMERVAEKNGVLWINDSKGTNVGATMAAISGLERPVILLAGGDGKGADFSPLRAITSHLKAAVLFGRDRAKIAEVFRDAVPTVIVETLKEAVQKAAELAERGDIVLLSPACASFDQFKNYKERGECFIEAVTAL